MSEHYQEIQPPKAKRPYNLTKQKPNKKEQIINAAIKVMCYYGYDGATVEKIAVEAGVSISLIGRHFGKKEDLAEICITRVFDTLFEKMQYVVSSSKNYREQVDKMFLLCQSSRNEVRLWMTLMATPAMEAAARRKMEGFAERTREIVGTHSHVDEKDLPQLTFIMSGLYLNYALTGHDKLFIEAKERVFHEFGIE